MIKTKALLTAMAMNLGVVSGTHAADAVHGQAVFGVWCTGCHEPLPGPSYAPPAGTYVLEIRGEGSAGSSYAGALDLTPVPLPAAFWLLGSGLLVGLGSAGRRRRGSSR